MPGLPQGTLRALLERLIPADEFPGAWDAGVGDYLSRLSQGQVELAPLLEKGLAGLDAEARSRHARAFEALSSDEQDALLEDVERGSVRAAWSTDPAAFFSRMTELAAEGYYADPGNGGNRGAASWAMLGFKGRPR